MDWLVAITAVLAGAGLVEPGAPFQAAPEIAGELKEGGSARPALPHEIPADAVEEPTAPIAVPDVAKLPPMSAPRIAAIAAVVAALTDDDWKATDYPKTDVLVAKLGWKPTGGEILRFKRTAA